MSKSQKNLSKRIRDIIYSIIGPFQHLLKPETGNQSPASSKMTSDIPIIGFDNPEKLAHGPCPHCKARVYIWMTEDGVELSTSSRMSDMKSSSHSCNAIEKPARSAP